MNESNRHSFEPSVRGNRVFILGAGFSAEAGIPLTKELLARALTKFELECPGIYARVANYARQCANSTVTNFDISTISFSDLCTYLEFIELREYGGGERWSENGSREKLALRFYLAKTIVESTPSLSSIPQLYLDFAAQLHENDVVISLNWDVLLERALESTQKPYNYSPQDGCIYLCKLHGSVNWRLDKPPSNTLDWQSLGATNGIMSRELYYSTSLLESQTWQHYQPLGEAEPFLVLPGYGKAFDVRHNAAQWYRPEFAFAYTHDVFIIGLSLADDDFLVRSYFLSTFPTINDFSGVDGRHVFIINPDCAAARNYDFVLRHGNAELINERFSSEHIALMTNPISDT